MKTIEKYTKAMKYADLKEILEQVETENYDIPTLIEFVEAEAATLAGKAAKAKAKQAERKTELDELAGLVLNALTEEPQTGVQVFEAVEDKGEEITLAKVRSRLSKLVTLGYAVKSEIAAVTASGKKTTHAAYAIPTPLAIEEVNE